MRPTELLNLAVVFVAMTTQAQVGPGGIGLLDNVS